MTNDKRVAAGIPAGGEFASHDRTEASVDLPTTAPTPAHDAFEAALTASWDAERKMLDLAEDAIRESALAEFPDAATAVFEFADDWSDSRLRFRGLLDHDGAEIAGSDELDDVDDLAGYFDDYDTVRKNSSFESYSDDVNKFTLDLAPAPYVASVDAIGRKIADVAKKHAELENELGALATAGIRRAVLDRFPSASKVVLRDDNEGPGSPYFTAILVQDADDVVIWNHNFDNDGLDDVLAELAPLLDRDPSALSDTRWSVSNPIFDLEIAE